MVPSKLIPATHMRFWDSEGPKIPKAARLANPKDPGIHDELLIVTSVSLPAVGRRGPLYDVARVDDCAKDKGGGRWTGEVW